MKILINYADTRFIESQKLNSSTGLNVGGFDRVISYGRKDIDEPFYQQNKSILDSRRGAGYWLWKPYIILKALEQSNNDDIIFYCDSGSYFIDSMKPLFKLLESQDIISFQLEDFHVEKKWTKRDTFVLIGLDEPKYFDTPQRLGGFQLIRNSPFSLKFYREYLAFAQNPQIITDIPNQCGKPNYPEFKDNRDDQSIFSLLTKKYNLPAYRDLSQCGNYLITPDSVYKQIINLTRDSK